MRTMPLMFLLGLGLTAILGVEFAAIRQASARDAREPFLVVAPPWRDAEAVVTKAGGWRIGPARAPLAVLAAGAEAEAFAAAGAWLVLDASRAAILCRSENR